MKKQSPIGVFDSGFGGLSVLKALIQLMPEREFVYLADIAHAPYGEQSDDYIIERSKKIAHFMHDELKTQGLVIACNTATAAAIQTLRQLYGHDWPIIGTEPGLKPAALKHNRIAVMATHSTLRSVKFQTLVEQVKSQSTHPIDIFLCSCHGLAKAIDTNDGPMINALVAHYCAQIQPYAPEVVVLGCTHYPLVIHQFQQALPHTSIIDTGEAIARRVHSLFPQEHTQNNNTMSPQHLQAWTSGTTAKLAEFIQHWLPEIGASVHYWEQKK